MTKLISILTMCLISWNTFGQISGTVFRDFNGNGVKDNTTTFNEPFVAGVSVKAFDAANVQLGATKITNASGDYSFTATEIPSSSPVRIEFSGLGIGDYNSFNGTGNGTNVQFVTSPNSAINFAINAPEDYNLGNSTLATQIFVNGLASNATQTEGITSFQYGANGTAGGFGLFTESNKNLTGSVWGIAYSGKLNKMYSAAFLKRHVGLIGGETGLGSIYETTPGGAADATLLINIPNVGTIASDATRGLGAPTGTSVDLDAFAKVGRVGLGDIDMAENDSILYAVNLFNKKLYVVNVISKIIVDSILIPSPCNSNSIYAPFALKVYRGKVYVGVTCDGSVSNSTNDITGSVYVFDPIANSFGASPVLTFPLNYARQAAWNEPILGANGESLGTHSSKWYPWIDVYNSTTMNALIQATREVVSHPQPLLSDIEFDESGNMIIAIMDRTGHQIGQNNRLPDNSKDEASIIGGDIVKANLIGSNAWTIETTLASGGEFFTGENYLTNHLETTIGGIAFSPGKGEVVLTAMDPLDFGTGGIIHLSNSTGTQPASSGFELHGTNYPSFFGKGNGLGDLELISPDAPIQIGNRIWFDANSNGIQDAVETTPGVPSGTTVTLHSPGLDGIYGNGDDQTWTTTTDASGNYYFSALSSADNRKPTSWTGVGNTILPGYDYRIEVATPASTQVTVNDVASNSVDNIDNDAVANGTNAYVTFNTGYTNHNFDIGFTTFGSIGNSVWTDLNGNGLNDEPSTAAISGVTVYLLDASNAIIDSTTTDLTGAYLFDSLASGTYYIQFPTSNGGNGLTTQTTTAQTDNNSDANTGTGISPAVVINTAGTGQDKDNTTIDAGYAPLGSIGNSVWTDLNGNGLNDEPSTAAISGVTVYLLNASNAIIDSTTTDLTGAYLFDSLASGTYYIQFPTSTGGNGLTTQTTNAQTDNNSDANTGTGISPAVVINTAGTGQDIDNTTIDAGYAPLCSLGNYVWNDINQDGIQNSNEVGVAGITVTLYDNSNAVIGSTTTDAYGYYKFDALHPSTYHVGFTLPANYQFTSNNTGINDSTDSDVNPSTGSTSNYTLAPGDSNMTADAGIYFVQPTTASVGNYVWFDNDHDGIQDSGENGISGVTVTLYNTSGNVVATTITDANGFYQFTDVTPGNYQVGFTTPVGLVFSPNSGTVNNPSNSDANPSTGMSAPFTVIAGDQITYVDAGLYTQPANNATLGDKVWYDEDQDGIQDSTETGVVGVTVTLYDATGTTAIATTTTDAFGDYVFNNLTAGQYVIGFSNLPTNYTLTSTSGADSTTNSDANPTTGKTNVINLSAGQYNMTYDAGIYSTIPANNNSLGNSVWNDVDKDGIQDATEVGVPGVTVTLYNASTNQVVSTTSTDADGFYLFPNLPNGTYYVGFTNLPVGYVFSPTGQGTTATDNNADPSTGLTSSVTLSGNTHDFTIDAGINLGNQNIGLGTLGDIVWYDLDNNGIQDPGESGVAGVSVTLYESDGTTIVSTTTTDALGNYIFTSLPSGNYVVGFSNLPAGFTISPKNADSQGINGEVNSDVNPGTMLTDIIALGQGEDKMSVDMGIVPPSGSASLGNLVWIDLNNDGLQTSGEPGVQGVGVTLYDATDNVVATTTTDAHGEYYFIGLVPGTYYVGFENLPQGYSFTTKDANTTGIDGAINSDADSTTGLTTTVTLAAGDNNLNLDAGIASTTVASVGDYVWYDLNRDGIQDANEPGLGGVLVTLLDNTNTPVASAITKPDGSYIFTNVTPGTYTMSFSNLPFGMEFTTQETNPTSNTGSNVNPAIGMTPSFTVTAGTHNPTIDAGLKTPFTGGLGNFVWNDLNSNGLQEPNEPGVPGVVVTLYDATGTTALATAVTDGNGGYSFTNLADGGYIVGFSNLPLNTLPTSNVGTIDDASNSDMLPSLMTNIATVTNGNYNANVDAGIVIVNTFPVHELKAISAVITNKTSCNVYWFTQQEMNTKNFSIERSTNGIDFSSVGTKLASTNTFGRTNYMFTDNINEVLNASMIYYRIKLYDIDNKVTISNIITVRPTQSPADVLVYPIPFTNEIKIQYPSDQNTVLTLNLVDMSGRVVASMQQEISVGLNEIKLLTQQGLNAGSYSLQLFNSGTGIEHFIKVIKVK